MKVEVLTYTKLLFYNNKHFYYIINILNSLKSIKLCELKLIETDDLFLNYINEFMLLFKDGESDLVINLKLDYSLNKIIRNNKLPENNIEHLFVIKHILLNILKYREQSFNIDGISKNNSIEDNNKDNIKEIIKDSLCLMRQCIDDDTRNNICAIAQGIDDAVYDEIKIINEAYFD